jgi:hypothetical protein
MQTADFNVDDFTPEAQRDMDAKLLVRFFTKPKQDTVASEKEGRPIFKDTEYVEIRVPGSRDVVCRPAKQRDLARFPRHYDMFKRRIETPEVGTPLAEWPLIARSQVEELTFFNCKTVEQLAEMSDSNAANFMGMNALRQKAKDWLVKATEDAKAEHLSSELAERDETIAKMQQEMAELKEMISLAAKGKETAAGSDSAEPSAPPTTTKAKPRRRRGAPTEE